MGMTYTVHDGGLDAYKVAAQEAARITDHYAERFGFRVVEWTRGESVFLVEMPMGYLGLVVEGLGTKNIVADALAEIAEHAGSSFYDRVARCAVAMIVNDMITLGAMPVVLGQYLAVQQSSWFDDAIRSRALVEGTLQACRLAKCTWGPGETPGLSGIIMPGTADLAGVSWGWIRDKTHLINPAKIRDGDRIVIVESSGIHANGLTMARAIAETLPDGYQTKLPDGRTYGETLLDPTRIYVGLMEHVLDQGVLPHYAVNITGHGLRKLMRAPQTFAYVIEFMPFRRLPIFDFIQQHGEVDDREMCRTFNMGAGFAFIVHPNHVTTVIESASRYDMHAYNVGRVEASDRRQVIIKPLGITFEADELAVR